MKYRHKTHTRSGWWCPRAIQFCRSGLGVSGGEVR